MGLEAASWLVSQSSLVDPGRSVPGFEASERRAILGGEGWRRLRPRQPSKRWGLDYESWEFEGAAARWPAQVLRDRQVRPSRLDIAWDFTCHESVTPDALADRCRSHAQSVGVSEGISGQGGKNTRYFGSAQSECRVRIYRRDWRDPALLSEYGPILRVEVVLRDEAAQAVWAVHELNPDDALRAAAWHVAHMMGVMVQAEVWSGPAPVCPTPEADAAQFLFQFIQQHSSTILAAREVGIDLAALAHVQRMAWAGSTRSRHRERVRLLAAVSARAEDAVGELVMAAAGRRRRAAS